MAGSILDVIKKIIHRIDDYGKNNERKKSLRSEVPFFLDASFRILLGNIITTIIIIPLNVFIFFKFVKNSDKILLFYIILNIVTFIIFNLIIFRILNILLIDRLFSFGLKIKNTSIGFMTYSSKTERRDVLSYIKTKLSLFFDLLRQILLSIAEKTENLQKTGNSLSTEMENTVDAVNMMNQSIDSTKTRIDSQFESVKKVTGVVDNLMINVEKLNKTIEIQASNVEESSSSIEEMIHNIASVSRITENAKNTVNELGKLSDDSKNKIMAVNTAVSEIANFSNKLREANKIITNITVQINMLAINASIEAAHAEDKGSGFAVVADNISNLAKMSAKEVKSIKKALDSIVHLIETVSDESAKVNNAFVLIAELINKVITLVEEIRNSIYEQDVGGKQIVDALVSMRYETEQVRVGSHEMLDGNNEIMTQINNLNDMGMDIKSAIDEINKKTSIINNTVSNVRQIVQINKNNITEITDEIARLKFEK